MSKIEQQKENMAKLLELVKENPDLRILPVVECEVVGDDSGLWIGAWDAAEIDEVYVDEGREQFFLKSWGFEDVEENEYGNLTEEEVAGLSDDEIDSLAEKKAEALPWEKVIVVRITTP